jgi:hypothetical protein
MFTWRYLASPIGPGSYGAPDFIIRLAALGRLFGAAFALRPRTVLVFSNGIPISIKSMKASVVRV